VLPLIPPERMKARVEHRVPLSDQALEVLRQEAKRRVNDVVFSGQKAGRPLSNMAFLMMLRRMGRDDLTVHGFRSTFRDWAAERTNVAPEVAEAARWHIRLRTRLRRPTGAATSLKRGAP
jgi:integrase